jgi:hypothetical protein
MSCGGLNLLHVGAEIPTPIYVYPVGVELPTSILFSYIEAELPTSILLFIGDELLHQYLRL